MPLELGVYDPGQWLPDGLTWEDATDAELHAGYVEYQRAGAAWREVYELPSVAEMLEDPAAMADTPWNPAEDPP